MSKEKTKEVLNQAVADLSQFATIIHQIHWYMRGKSFLNLHPKMDEYMDDINDHLDQVAERLIIIGGAPYSTLSEFKEHTKLEDQQGNYNVTEEEHIECLIKGYRYLQNLYQVGIEAAEEEKDAVTADMLTTLKQPIEKNIWMLSAVLNKAPALEE